MFKAKSFLVALCTECIWPWAIFTIVFILFLHFWLSWCPRDNIYKATFVRTHVSTSLVALIQSKCHSPPLCVYFIILSYIGWLFFYLKKRGAHSPLSWHADATFKWPPPPPSIAIWTKVKVSPQHPRPHIQQNPFKAVTQHAFFLACRVLWLLSMLAFVSVWLM